MSETQMSYTRDDLQKIIYSMEAEAVNFGYRFIRDANVRMEYMVKTKAMSQELLSVYEAGLITPRQAADTANKMRNEIMEFARVKSSDLGRAKARQLKAKGLNLDALLEKYALKKYSRSFHELSDIDRNKIYLEIVQSSGRANPNVSIKTRRLGNLGKGLWLLTACVAVYNVSVADDKAFAAGREVANIGGGFGGGAAGGAVAGIWFGPVGVAVGVIVGGTLGAIMSDQIYVEIVGPSGEFAKRFIPRFTNLVSTDEQALADALLTECTYELDKVLAVFVQLSDKYSTDVDDVALLYVNNIKTKASNLVKEAFKAHTALRKFLVQTLESGWTSDDERKCIQYIQAI